MPQTAAEYVINTSEGGWRIVGSRISLDSVVHAYWDGQSPETIVEEFPTLTAEQVYGAIAFYLCHRAEIDRYLSDREAAWNQFRGASRAQHGPLLDRIRASRKPTTREENSL